MDETDFRAVAKMFASIRNHEEAEKRKPGRKLAETIVQAQSMKELSTSLYEGLRTGESKPIIFYLHVSLVLFEDQLAWDVIRWVINEHVSADDPTPLPEPLKRLWLGISFGTLKPPGKTRGRKPQNYKKYCNFLMLLHDRKKFDLKLDDAVHIISCHFHTSEENVRRIWKRRHDNKSPLSDFYEALQSERKKIPENS